MTIFKKILKGEIDLFDMAVNRTKEVTGRIAKDIQDELYLQGVVKNPSVEEAIRKIEMKMNTSRRANINDINTIDIEESFDFSSPKVVERVKRVENTEKVTDNSVTPLIQTTVKPSKEIIKAVEKTITEIGVKFEITEVKVGSRWNYVFIDILDSREEELFIRKSSYIENRIGRYLSPINKQGTMLARTASFSRKNGEVVRGWNGYVLGVESASRTLHKENTYHLLQKNSLEFVLEVEGELRVFDFAKMPHALIAGTTGSGKSVLQNAMISSFLNSCTPDSLQMSLVVGKVDTDGNDLLQFRDYPHVRGKIVTPANKDLKEFLLEVLDQCIDTVEIMDSREDDAMQGITPEAYHLLVIDEITDIVSMQDRTSSQLDKELNSIKSAIVSAINKITRKGRSSKVHVLLATQSPRSKDIGAIKANLSIIALKVTNKIECSVVGYQNAIKLLGQGDGYVNFGGEIRFQSPM